MRWPLTPRIVKKLRVLGAESRDPWVAAALFEAAARTKEVVRTTLLMRGLASVDDPDVFQRLIELVDGPWGDLRSNLPHHLDPVKRTDHRRWLERAWLDPEPEVRLQAALRLAVTLPEGITWAQRLKDRDPDARVRAQLEEHFSARSQSPMDPHQTAGPAFSALRPFSYQAIQSGFELATDPDLRLVLRRDIGIVRIPRPPERAKLLVVRGTLPIRTIVTTHELPFERLECEGSLSRFRWPSSLSVAVSGPTIDLEFRVQPPSDVEEQTPQIFEIESMTWE